MAQNNNTLIYPTTLQDAIANRDAHAYDAIKHMAAAAGQTVAEWEQAHVGGLSDAEKRAYDEYRAQFNRGWMANEADRARRGLRS